MKKYLISFLVIMTAFAAFRVYFVKDTTVPTAIATMEAVAEVPPITSIITEPVIPTAMGILIKISDQLAGKTAAEKVEIKSVAIVKVRTLITGSYDNVRYGLHIDIRNVEKIDGGIQLFARAWKGAKQLGFGKDGSVEWERFRIFNPPILVPDGTKRTHTMHDGTQVQVDNFKEDPAAAVRLSLAHTIHLVGKTDTNIVSGKDGNTTSTFYPAAGASSPADGMVEESLVNGTWTTLQGAAGDAARNSDTQDYYDRIVSGSASNGWNLIVRGIFMFDTSTIDDGDTVSSATLSLFGSLKDDTIGIAPTLNIYSSAPAATSDVVAGDYDSLGTTAFSTGITQASFSTTAYNDFALNSSGIANISVSAVSKFGSRDATYDAANSAPTWSASAGTYMGGYMADQAGTTNDPKLVVVHAVAAVAAPTNEELWWAPF